MRLTYTLLALGMFSVAMCNSVSASGNAEAGKAMALTCGACHGQDGNKVLAPNYPKLAGQNEKYLTQQMLLIQSGARAAPLMAGQLNGKSEQQIQDLAAYFTSLEAGQSAASEENLALGEQIYRGGILNKNVSACTACHAPSGHGNSLAGFPRIAGQSFAYMVEQLTKYREGERTSDELYGGMMRQVAGGMTDGEIKAVANYVLGLR